LILYRDRQRKLAFKVSRQLNIFELYKSIKNRVKQAIATFHKRIIYTKLSSLQYSSQIWSKLRSLGLVKDKANKIDFPVSLDNMAHELTVVPKPEVLDSVDYGYQIQRPVAGEQFHFSCVEPIHVCEAISKITSSAEGTDGICIKMLNLIAFAILSTLTNIINSSLQMSDFPQRWKKALLCPIPKVRNPTSAREFRPISLLCTLSKVTEKIVFNQLAEYINFHNIFDPLQSGY
jgi:hypothetical protein